MGLNPELFDAAHADAEVMTRRDLRVVISDDGIFLRFIASDGGELGFDVLALARELELGEARIQLQRCRDRFGDAAAYNLPADVREEVEDRIAGLASLIDAKAAKRS